MDTLFVIPQQLVHQYWHLAIPHLQRALNAGNGEFTIDQLKLFTAEGNCILLLVLNSEKQCTCALTIQWITYPNDRVCYITYIGCLLYTSPSPRDRTRSRMPSSA